MIKKPVKGILLGLLIWITGFIIGSIVMMMAGMEMIGIVMIFVMPVLAALVAWWYLRKNPRMSEGLKLGIIWIVINAVLDILVLVLAFGNGFSYFASWTVWVGYAEMLIVPALVGKMLEGKSEGENKEEQ